MYSSSYALSANSSLSWKCNYLSLFKINVQYFDTIVSLFLSLLDIEFFTNAITNFFCWKQ